MTAVKRSPKETVAGDFRENTYDRKTLTSKVFEEFETDRESYGSSSEDMENYSPKSVVLKFRKWPAAVKDVYAEVFGRRVRNQIERIRAEDSHLGEDIGECLIARVFGSGYDLDDETIIYRPASPLSGKVAVLICIADWQSSSRILSDVVRRVTSSVCQRDQSYFCKLKSLSL